jgi:hypothetical protein
MVEFAWKMAQNVYMHSKLQNRLVQSLNKYYNWLCIKKQYKMHIHICHLLKLSKKLAQISSWHHSWIHIEKQVLDISENQPESQKLLDTDDPSGDLTPPLLKTTENRHSDDTSEELEGAEPIPPLKHISDDLEIPESDLVALGDSDVAAEILSEGLISLIEVVESREPTLNIHSHIRGQFSKYPFFKQITDDPMKVKNFEVSNDLVFLKEMPPVYSGCEDWCTKIARDSHFAHALYSCPSWTKEDYHLSSG